jgi:EAL domain-containing protein (putative c-di-GMP-specific phosphodiesterase class I)
VGELTVSADSVAIVRAVVGMGKSLGMTIVVEGVETEEQLAILKAEGCDVGQGYLFSRPISSGAIRAIIAHGSAMIRSAA